MPSVSFPSWSRALLRAALTGVAVVLAVVASPLVLVAQSVAGTWVYPTPSGQLVLTLQVSGANVSGSLAGNGNTFTLKGRTEDGEAYGTIEGGGGTAIFTAAIEGQSLVFSMTENGPNGQPNPQSTRELTFARGSAGAAAAGATAGAAAGAAKGAAGGNPLAGGAAARAGGNPLANRADPFVGTFANNELRVDVRKNGAGYGGALTINGEQIPFTGSAAGSTLTGSFAVGPQKYSFTAQVAGDAMSLTSEGTTYRLARGGASAGAAAPAVGAMPAQGGYGALPNGGAPGAMGGGAPSGQDAQIMQLLMSSPWCTMSYSGGSTYTGGSYGRTTTERVVFAAGGQGVLQRGNENTNSGAPGSAYMGQQSGERFLWKVQGSVLMLSANGMQWDQTPLQIYDNGNGYPIVKANNKEYNQCR